MHDIYAQNMKTMRKSMKTLRKCMIAMRKVMISMPKIITMLKNMQKHNYSQFCDSITIQIHSLTSYGRLENVRQRIRHNVSSD